jgi:hypothetical protein
LVLNGTLRETRLLVVGLFDFNGEANRVRKKLSSAIIIADFR